MRFSAWLRVVAAVVLGALSVVQLLPALHHALVRHEVCPEHGELVHASDVHRHEAGSDARTASFRADAEVGHEHEHCGVSAATRAAGVLPSDATSGLTFEPSERALRLLPASSEARSIALLSLAPKLPPPLG